MPKNPSYLVDKNDILPRNLRRLNTFPAHHLRTDDDPLIEQLAMVGQHTNQCQPANPVLMSLGDHQPLLAVKDLIPRLECLHIRQWLALQKI